MKFSKSMSVIILYILVLVLLPFSRLSELPLLVLSVMGIHAFITKYQELKRDSAFRLLTVIFLCYFGMIIVSAPDSYWRDKTLTVALASWRYYFSAIALLAYLQVRQRRMIISAISIIATIWAIDALLQYQLGFDLIGRESYPGRLNGVFGTHHVKLGPVLALLLPVLLAGTLNLHAGVRWLSVLSVIVVIILSGTRSAWLMMIFTLLAYWIHHVRHRRFLLLVKTSVLALLIVFVLWFVSPDFKQRMERSLAVFEGSQSAIDFALANRLPIWKTSLRMIAQHPLNGIGAHAFRKAYPEYAEQGDIWQEQGGVGMHAHHWMLEVMAETGILGMMLVIFAIYRLFRYIKFEYTDESWPFIVALTSAFLPVASTYSIFSSFWSICLWFCSAGLLIMSQKNA